MVKPTDMPDPSRFAPGAAAAALDNQAFFPTALTKGFDPILGADAEVHSAADDGAINSGNDDSHVFSNHAPRHAVSLRIDPCANILEAQGDDSKCQQQLRILWQANTADDTNIHTIYQIARPELGDITHRLLQLQQASGLDYAKMPLQAQPAIVKQGLNGSYYKGVLGIIHSYARASRLVNVAGLASNAAGDEKTNFGWVMVLAAVKDGKLIGVNVPAVALGQMASLCRRSVSPAKQPETRTTQGILTRRSRLGLQRIRSFQPVLKRSSLSWLTSLILKILAVMT